MPRPRSYARADAVEAAKNTFWERGYDRTAIADLERNTGLSRSSLYLAFGPKRALLSTALDSYTESFIGPLLAPMEARGAGLDNIVAFLLNVRDVLLEDPVTSARGCLMVNTIAEMSGWDQDAQARSASYRDQLRRAFTHALQGSAATQSDRRAVKRRASMLVAGTLGVWISARVDPTDAAETCAAIAGEVEAWRSSANRHR